MPTRTGFSIIELIVVISLVSILSIFVLPRLSLTSFKEAGFGQQAAAAVRYAQKQAIASGCTVHVSITATGCSLNWLNPSAAVNCPANNTVIPNPASGGSNFCRDSTPGATGGLPASFSFDKIGRPKPNTTQNINLGNKTLRVEAETGYTHEI